MSRRLYRSLGLMAALAMLLGTVLFGADRASAATTVEVTEANLQNWARGDMRGGGAVNFVVDSTAPSGAGSLQLTTTASSVDKAQYMLGPIVPLAEITELGYYTKQQSASFVGGDASYQLVLCLGGDYDPSRTDPTPKCTAGFTTMVFEPYQNGTVTPGIWQSWDVDAGQFWSSRNYSSGTCQITAGGGGAPFYTLATLKMNCPGALVIGIGVNIGSNNPSYNVFTDLVSFNGTTFDFEPTLKPDSKDACKNGGWQTFNTPRHFKNQGDCIQFVNTGK